MQQKWVYKLLDYNFLVKYKRDKENVVGNGLSRRDEDCDMTLLTVTIVSVSQIELLEELKLNYDGDLEIQTLLQKWERKELNSLDPRFTVKDGLLYYKHRLYIANHRELKVKFLQVLHDGPTKGHLRFDKTMYRMRR